MRHVAVVPEPLRAAPFTVAQAAAVGVTGRRLAGPAFRRVLPGIHVAADVADGPATRLQAAGLLVPPGGAVGGRWAAWAWGADVLRAPDEPVEVLVPSPGRCLRRGGGVRSPCVALRSDDVRGAARRGRDDGLSGRPATWPGGGTWWRRSWPSTPSCGRRPT